MKKDYTHIAVVLDRSGSMASCADDTVGGFNTFVDEQKKGVGAATFTLAQFDNIYEIVHNGIDIKTVPPIEFLPRGGTALLDAIGKTIAITGEWLRAKPEAERPERVVFVILTDGEENASTEYKRPQIMDMIQHQESAYNWQFVFLAANQDAIAAGGTMGVQASASLTYNAGKSRQAYRTLSNTLTNARSGASSRIGFTKEDRDLNKPD